VGEFNLSIEYSLKALDLIKKDDPLLCDIYTNLGQAYNNLGNYHIALFYFHKNIRLKGLLKINNVWIEYKRIGSLYLNRAIYDSAFYYYNKEFTSSEQDSISKFNYNNNIGIVFHKKGEFKKARFFYKKALSFNNNEALTYLNLAELEALDHKNKQANIYLQLALIKNPSLPQLANVYFLLKKYKQFNKVNEVISKNKAIDYANEQDVRGTEIRVTCEIERESFLLTRTRDQFVSIVQVIYILLITCIAVVLGYAAIFSHRLY